MRTIVYVDGFNLYYGCLRSATCPHKWLDLGKLFSLLLPGDQIEGIKYFTARVTPRAGNPDIAQRQQIYFRALETVPNLSIYYGHFLTNKTRMGLVSPAANGPATAEVWKTEEKGSDVNLATHLVADGFRGLYDRAVIVSNDGDLKEPVGLVRNELGLPVGVLNPHRHRSWALSPQPLPAGSFYRPIRQASLAASQFPATLSDATGTITKPAVWL